MNLVQNTINYISRLDDKKDRKRREKKIFEEEDLKEGEDIICRIAGTMDVSCNN